LIRRWGIRLVTFAVHWVKAEMHEFIIRNWRIVRVATTKAQRKLFFNLRKHKPEMSWLSPEEMQGIADKLGVAFKDVKEMEMRLYAHDSYLDAPAQNDNQDGSRSVLVPREHLIANQSIIDADPLDQLEQKAMGQKASSGILQALSVLDDRARDIIEQRWLAEPEKIITLKELANKYQISIERVRQLEQAALKKLKLAIE
jgi:RNA polymerase sigma-32 factor